MRALADDVDLTRVGRYRGLDEVRAALAALPGARPREVGRTNEDRALPCVELGPRDAAKVTLVIAGVHAMEWIGVETALALAAAWASAPPAGRRLVLVPVVNADGYARVESDLRAGRRRYVRANARGVDLNRNFAVFYRPFHLWPAIFRVLGGPGSGPVSEPETRAVIDVIEAEKGRVDRAVSLHSIGRKLLLPHGGRWKPPPEIATLRALASEVSAGLGGRYGVVQTSHWVPGTFVYGMELDHFQSLGITSLLVECSAGGLSLRDPSSWVHPFRWYNPRDPEAQSEEIARALRPFVAPGD